MSTARIACFLIVYVFKVNESMHGNRSKNDSNIDAVTNIARVKAREHYGERSVLDVEAAMLSNHSTAVKLYIEKKKKARDRKNFIDGLVEPAKRRSENHGPGSTTLGDMQNKE